MVARVVEPLDAPMLVVLGHQRKDLLVALEELTIPHTALEAVAVGQAQ
jgi:hypothetical protein